MLDEIVKVLDAATGAEGGLAVVLVALVAWGKQWVSGRQSADDAALDHLARSADRNLNEMSRLQDRYLEVLERAAVLQGELTALERENSSLRTLMDADEDEEISRLDAIEGMLSDALSASDDDDDETTDKFRRG